jgi:hypothetical protein
MVLDGVIQQIEAQKHIDEASRSKPQIVHEHVLSAEQMQSQTDLGTRLAQSGIGFSEYLLNHLSATGEAVLKGLNLLNPLHAKSAHAAEPTTTMIDGIVSAPGKFKIPSAERAEQDMVTPVDALCNMIPNLSEVFTKDFDNQKYMPNLTAKDAQKFLALLSHIKGQKRAKMVIEDPTYKYVKPLVKALADQTGKPTILYVYADDLSVREDSLFTATRGMGAVTYHLMQNYGDLFNFVKLKLGTRGHIDKKIATYVSEEFGVFADRAAGRKTGYPAQFFFDAKGNHLVGQNVYGGERTLKGFYKWLDKGLLHLPRELLGDKDFEIYKGRAFKSITPEHLYVMGVPATDVRTPEGFFKARSTPFDGRGKYNTDINAGEDVKWCKYAINELTGDLKSSKYEELKPVLAAHGINPEMLKKLVTSVKKEKTRFFDDGYVVFENFDQGKSYVFKGKEGIASAILALY